MTITKIGKLQQLELGELIETLDPDHDGKVSIDRYVALGKKLRAAQANQTWTWGKQFGRNGKAFCYLVAILVAGMFVFQVLEKKNWDDYVAANNTTVKAPLKDSLPLVPYMDQILAAITSDATLKAQVQAIVDEHTGEGNDMFSRTEYLFNPYEFRNPWEELESSLYFVLSLATTIGYGNFAPKTDAGKMFTIAYSIPAIIGVGWFMKENVDSLQHLDWTIGLRWQALVGLVILVGYMALSAWFFEFVFSGWSFLDGIYFTWVTISTIGFGDLLPDISSWDRNLGILVVLVIGIHVASVVIAIGSEVIAWIQNPEQRSERFEQKLMHGLEMGKFEAIKKDLDII